MYQPQMAVHGAATPVMSRPAARRRLVIASTITAISGTARNHMDPTTVPMLGCRWRNPRAAESALPINRPMANTTTASASVVDRPSPCSTSPISQAPTASTGPVA